MMRSECCPVVHTCISALVLELSLWFSGRTGIAEFAGLEIAGLEVRHFPVLQIPPLRLRPSFSTPANSSHPLKLNPYSYQHSFQFLTDSLVRHHYSGPCSNIVI